VPNYPEPAALKPLTGASFTQYTVQNIELKERKKTPAALAVCSHSGSVARADSVPASQSKDGRGVCLLGQQFYSLPWFASSERMEKAEIAAFLMALVSERNVSSFTLQQALSSLLFLYGKVLGVELR